MKKEILNLGWAAKVKLFLGNGKKCLCYVLIATIRNTIQRNGEATLNMQLLIKIKTTDLTIRVILYNDICSIPIIGVRGMMLVCMGVKNKNQR